MIDETVFSTISEFGMLYPGDNVIACVSGGADSMALLFFLHKNKETLGIGELSACHFNHGLRGADSDRDAETVRAYCARLGVPLETERGGMASKIKPQGESVETWARALRYAFFLRLAKEKNAKVATAHNLNDNAETLLFRLARGTGLRGAGGIPPVRGDIIRPFLRISRADIEAYCAEHAIPFENDATNDADDYARNRIRHAVLPALCGVNGRALENMGRFCERALALSAYTEEKARALLAAAQGEVGWDAALLLRDGELPALYALELLLRAYALDEKRLRLALAAAKGEIPAVQLNGKTWLRREHGILRIEREGEIATEKCALEPQMLHPGANRFGEKTVFARYEEINHEQSGNFDKSLLNNALDCAKIFGNIILRGRREGDRFTSARRKNTKSLKKLFNEMEIPARERDAVPILCDERGVLFVGGAGPSLRAAVSGDTRKILYITIE
ncbi:MAG: tRNA lysidine(34) synthetase TilS [Oscillospiraceae bacterium]|nr:tRNA lysidine(34) synthetase TilS [Oscillospiraceae bacterium]